MSSTQTDWRGLCEELVLSWDADGCDWNPQHQARWNATVDRARAVLAQPEHEAGPTDWRVDVLSKAGLAMSDVKAYAARTWPHAPGEINDSEWQEGLVDLLIGALDELWLSRPAPAPAGEVAELVAWLRDHAYVLNPSAERKARHICDLLEQRQAAPAPAGEVAELVAALLQVSDGASARGDEGTSWITARAADLLKRLASPACLVLDSNPETIAALKAAGPGRIELLPEDAQIIEPTEHTILVPVPVPVPVSERPWEREGWCDESGRCWMGWPGGFDCWVGVLPSYRYCRPQDALSAVTSLPAHALPLPSGEVG
jgi:hypothetical protein